MLLAEKISCLEESPTMAFAETVRRLMRTGVDVVDLTGGEPDFDTLVSVKHAAIEAIQQGKTKYVSSRGIRELREAIVSTLHAEYGMTVDPECDVIVTPGGKQALFYAFMALLNPGDEVVISDPYWGSFRSMVEIAGGKLVSVPTREEAGFRMNPDDLEAAITPKTKLLVLVNPNNPTGALLERDDLLRIADVVQRHDLFVIADEIYSKIVFDRRPFVNVASLPGMAKRTLTVNGFSKAFSMTGWRIGYAYGPSHLIESMVKLQQHTATCAASFTQYGALAELQTPSAFATDMVRIYEERRNLIVQGIRRMPRYACMEPRGAFYFFLNIKSFGKPSAEIAQALLKHVRLASVPGSSFGSSGEGYLRCSFAVSTDVLMEALNRLEVFQCVSV